MISLGIVFTLYAFTNISYLSILGVDEVANTDALAIVSKLNILIYHTAEINIIRLELTHFEDKRQI